MEATLSKWGNSLAIRIPNYILKKLNLVENSSMNIDVVAGKIVLSKQKNRLETLCSAITEEMSDHAIEELTDILRRSHKIKEGGIDDFTIRSQAEMMETMSTTMDTVTMILGIAAGFSLLIAGIGIMNIMLVSVTERTKEIGLRMAVGATGLVISIQFLIESIFISLTGGIFGVLLGVGASSLLPKMGMPSIVPAWSIFLSFGVCVVIGILFGYIPARKAANMDPIDAIRHE